MKRNRNRHKHNQMRYDDKLILDDENEKPNSLERDSVTPKRGSQFTVLWDSFKWVGNRLTMIKNIKEYENEEKKVEK